jgi:hypothetical protein
MICIIYDEYIWIDSQFIGNILRFVLKSVFENFIVI